MADYAGTLQRLILSRTLWLIVGWPLAGCLWQLLVARPRLRRAQGPDAKLRALASTRVAGLGGLVLAATATVGHAVLLLRLPPGGRVLFEPVARGARFEQLDAGVDLLLDSRSLAACALACGVTLAAGVVVALQPPPARGWRPWAWMQLALAGALLSFLADGFVSAAMGWALAGVAGSWLAGWRDPGRGAAVATRMALAIAAMVCAAALLFWGLGGSWEDEVYTADAQPRLVAVQSGASASEASLSMAEPVGSRVFVDDARGASLRVPFSRAALSAGSHSFRVRTGDGADDIAVAAVEVAPGESVAIVPIGPTLSFHTMADELSLRSGAGRSTLRRAVEERVGPGGVAVVAGALLVLLGAAAAASAWVPPPGAPLSSTAVAAGATSTGIGSFLLMRLDFLFPSAHQTGVVVASVGAMIVLGAMWRALGFVGARRWLTFASAAPAGLTLMGLGLGGITPALEVMVGAGILAAGVHLVALVRADTVEELVPWPTDDQLLVRVPAQLGDLLVSMERWVVGAVASAAAGCAQIAAWIVARVDDHVVSSPGDRVASGVEWAAASLESLVGAPLGRVAWALMSAAAIAALLHAMWPGS
jgi:hypothetical protein